MHNFVDLYISSVWQNLTFVFGDLQSSITFHPFFFLKKFTFYIYVCIEIVSVPFVLIENIFLYKNLICLYNIYINKNFLCHFYNL